MTDRRERETIASCGNALRAHARRHQRRRRQGVTLGVFIAAVIGSIVLSPRPLLVWNVSASAPIGLYVIGRGEIATGEMVLSRLPERWRKLAGARHYIPINVPLVKRVAAEPGDTVCALREDIFVNGRWVAERRNRDGAGRFIPWWSGCLTLRRGSMFLLMDSPDSFDGRYFGPTQRGDVVGTARLVWRR